MGGKCTQKNIFSSILNPYKEHNEQKIENTFFLKIATRFRKLFFLPFQSKEGPLQFYLLFQSIEGPLQFLDKFYDIFKIPKFIKLYFRKLKYLTNCSICGQQCKTKLPKGNRRVLMYNMLLVNSKV